MTFESGSSNADERVSLVVSLATTVFNDSKSRGIDKILSSADRKFDINEPEPTIKPQPSVNNHFTWKEFVHHENHSKSM